MKAMDRGDIPVGVGIELEVGRTAPRVAKIGTPFDRVAISG
jgi:hypothetical protein